MHPSVLELPDVQERLDAIWQFYDTVSPAWLAIPLCVRILLLRTPFWSWASQCPERMCISRSPSRIELSLTHTQFCSHVRPQVNMEDLEACERVQVCPSAASRAALCPDAPSDAATLTARRSLAASALCTGNPLSTAPRVQKPAARVQTNRLRGKRYMKVISRT